MIVRQWHGWTAPAHADTYERLLREEIFRGIDSLDAVRAFAGDDYEAAVVPPRARELLLRFDALSAHYEVRETSPPGRPEGRGS